MPTAIFSGFIPEKLQYVTFSFMYRARNMPLIICNIIRWLFLMGFQSAPYATIFLLYLTI